MTIAQSISRIREAQDNSSLKPEQFWEALANLSRNDAALHAALQKDVYDSRRPNPNKAAHPIQ